LKINDRILPAPALLISPLFLCYHLLLLIRPGPTMTVPSWFLCGLVLASSQIRRVSSASICYDRSGTQDEKHPCNPSAENSACCAPGEICYSRGLCTPGPQLGAGRTPFFTSSCTDPSWNASACVSNCNRSTSASEVGKGPTFEPKMIANQSCLDSPGTRRCRLRFFYFWSRLLLLLWQWWLRLFQFICSLLSRSWHRSDNH